MYNLERFGSHEQPQECPKCGSRTSWEGIPKSNWLNGDKSEQYHKCNCGFEFILVECTFYHEFTVTFGFDHSEEFHDDIPYEDIIIELLKSAQYWKDNPDRKVFKTEYDEDED